MGVLKKCNKLKRKGVSLYNRRKFSCCELWRSESFKRTYCVPPKIDNKLLKPRYILIKFCSFKDEEEIPQ